MRLIDADKLKFKHKCHYGEHTTRPYTLFCISFEEIQKAPTIKAIPIEVLDKIRAEIDKELLTYSIDVENMGDSAQKIRISLGIVRKIIDKYREEQE